MPQPEEQRSVVERIFNERWSWGALPVVLLALLPLVGVLALGWDELVLLNAYAVENLLLLPLMGIMAYLTAHHGHGWRGKPSGILPFCIVIVVIYLSLMAAYIFVLLVASNVVDGMPDTPLGLLQFRPKIGNVLLAAAPGLIFIAADYAFAFWRRRHTKYSVNQVLRGPAHRMLTLHIFILVVGIVPIRFTHSGFVWALVAIKVPFDVKFYLKGLRVQSDVAPTGHT